MSRLQSPGSIARAAVVVALLSSRPAQALDLGDPGPTRPPGGLVNNLVTGVQYDIVNQAKAERRLQHVHAKFQRHAERGDSAAADRDLRRIENLKYRIVVDDWLIRKNLLQDPGYYPYPLLPHPMSCAAVAQATRPVSSAYPPQGVPTPPAMATAPTISIKIVNAGPAEANIAFAINGVAHQANGGSRQDLAVAPNSILTYDGGGSFGRRQYRIAPGVFEFRPTAEGWALYQLPSNP